MEHDDLICYVLFYSQLPDSPQMQANPELFSDWTAEVREGGELPGPEWTAMLRSELRVYQRARRDAVNAWIAAQPIPE